MGRELVREWQNLTGKEGNFEEVNDSMSRSQYDVTSVLPN